MNTTDDWADTPVPPHGQDIPVPGQQETAPLFYGSTDEFVREHLRFIYRRRIDGRNRYWAARWWEYPEAVIRLESLWRSWEHLRQDPSTGTSSWFRDHADYHMAILMSPDGPFATAPDTEENTCKKGDPLPYTPPPPGVFTDVRE